MATIELYGIVAEVPEGHEDFRVCGAVAEFRAPLACGPLEIGGKRLIYSWMGIEALFLRDFETGDYYQRRVVDAARCWFYDYAEELQSRYEEIGGGRPWTKEDDDQAKALLTEIRAAEHEADHWQLIGEAAQKAAKGGGE